MSDICYRDGGCGPNEMRSCNDCPASKPGYSQRVLKLSASELARRITRAAADKPQTASTPISLEDYRRDAMRTYPHELARNERRDYAAMKLSEEAAEFMAVVNKSQYQGETYSRERIRDELGDVLWALMVNLTEHNLTLDEIMLANVAKRRVRYPEGV